MVPAEFVVAAKSKLASPKVLLRSAKVMVGVITVLKSNVVLFVIPVYEFPLVSSIAVAAIWMA